MSRNAEKLVKSWDSYYAEGVLSPLSSSAAVAVLREGSKHTVLMPDGTEEIVEGNSCSCGHERADEKSDRGTEARQGWKNRLAASCDHQEAALQAVDVGGACECGELKVERTNHEDSYGNTVMQSYACAGCGVARRER